MRESVTNALVKKSEQLQATAELLLENTRDWQVIQQYLCNRLEEGILTKEQQKKLERYQYIYNQMVSGKYTDPEILNQVCKMYCIKKNQAYHDMNATREIFSTVVNLNKRFELSLQLQINRNMMRKAEELGDMRAVAQLEKNRALLLRLIPDEDETPAEMFEGHEIEAVFDPKLLGIPDVDIKAALEAINEKRKVKIKTELFTYIPFEESADVKKTSL